MATFLEVVASEFCGDVNAGPFALKLAGELCRYAQAGLLILWEGVVRTERLHAGRMPFDPPTTPAEARLIRAAIAEVADREPYLLMIQRHLRLVPDEDVRAGLSLLIVRAQLHRLSTGREAAQF